MHTTTFLAIAAIAGTSLAAPGWTDKAGNYGSYAPYASYGSYGKPPPPPAAPPAPSPTTPVPGIPSDIASIDVTFYAGLDCTGGVTKSIVGLVADDSVCHDDGVAFKSYKITRVDKELTGAALNNPNNVWGFEAGVLKKGVNCDFSDSGIVKFNEPDTFTRCISPAIPGGKAAQEYQIVQVALN